MSTAFQPNAFQPNAFQIGKGASGSGSSYTLTCSAGAYVYTGQAATLNRGIKLTCAAGAYVYTGQAATLTYVPANTNYTLACSVGAYVYTGQAATLNYVSNNPVTGHSGGDDGWKKEKPKKRKDDYKTNLVARKQAVLDAYNGLLEPETPDAIAEEVKNVIQLTPIVDLDLSKVRKLLALWEQELTRREEDDDEEAILLLL